jgi:rod shape-determining protein MreC
LRLVARNRTGRVAVLGSSVQRAASGYSSTRSGALKRRIVVVALVVASLALITVSFRSSALNSTEGFGASVLRPFEVAANRVARPFRDAVNYTNGVFNAKAENRRLRKAVEFWRQQASLKEAAVNENRTLRRQLDYQDSSLFPQDYTAVNTRVLTNPPATFDQTITIAAGSDDGIVPQDAVITPDGLVGQVTKVFSGESKVMLITDPESAVSATDANHPSALGLLEHGSGTNSISLDRITKDKPVSAGDTIITAGSPGHGLLPSVYPRGILIGTVTNVGLPLDTDLYKPIEVQPFVDLSGLESVTVLIPKPTPPPPAKATATAKKKT